MPGWNAWHLTDQAAIDACADAILEQGYTSEVRRGKDPAGNIVRAMDIHWPNDPLKPQTAELGRVVVLMGDMVLLLTADQYAASPFYEAP
jgi:hypothetical protein